MSAEGIELLKRGYADFNSGDFEHGGTLLHPEIEWVDPVELPGSTTHRGPEDVVAWWDSWSSAWGGIAMEPTEYVDLGDDRYFVTMDVRATGAASGVPLELNVWAVWLLEDGKARRAAHYLDEDAARREAGLAS